MADETPFDPAEHPSGTSRFKRGAKPSPPHKLLAAPPYMPAFAPPPQFAVIPKKLSMWLNDQTGDCVTAQEAFSKAAWSVQCGLDELFVPDAEVGRWARKYGFYDGATLTDVMDEMQKDGFTVGGQNYKDGAYNGVDYSSDAVLQSALTVGPVNIAIDANALPSGAGNNMGWYATGKGRFPNTDHCVALCGYGPAAWLYQQLGVALPSALTSAHGYLLFTWNTIGFVDHDWLMGTCVEAWVRNPTTPGQTPGPQPGPGPGPGPIPNASGVMLASDYKAGFYTFGVAPDAAAVLNAINALLAACGQPSIPPMAMPAGKVPWAVLVQIFVLIGAFVAGPITPASALALVNAILALFGKPPLTSLGSLYQMN